jgi:hypothetical protein
MVHTQKNQIGNQEPTIPRDLFRSQASFLFCFFPMWENRHPSVKAEFLGAICVTLCGTATMGMGCKQ